MIKIGNTDQKGHPKGEIDTFKKNANILEDNGETRPKKAFWSKT